MVWGDHDHILPYSHLKAASGALPHAESYVFSKTGHMPQIERPDEFAAVVEGFLARHLGRRRQPLIPAGNSGPPQCAGLPVHPWSRHERHRAVRPR